MSVSRCCLKRSFWREDIIENAIAMVSSCIRRLNSVEHVEPAVDAHHRVGADLEVDVRRLALDRDLEDVVDVHPSTSRAHDPSPDRRRGGCRWTAGRGLAGLVYRGGAGTTVSGDTLTPVQGPAVILVAIYAAVLVAASLSRSGGGSGLDYLLDGRRLTLPAFVATLVTTWYGGILGIGEYAFRFGVSTWVVFGLPYYLAAVVFALWLAPRLRASGAASIPDLMRSAYGPRAGVVGAASVWALTLPVAYVLMAATLLSGITGWSTPTATAAVAAFSAAYVALSGFRAVVRTDALQLVLMYGGFLILLPAALDRTGGLAALWNALPDAHRSAGRRPRVAGGGWSGT